MLKKETILESTLAFGKKYVAPLTQEADKEGKFPKSAYDALRKEGYMGLLVPKEYGGLGGGNYEHTQVCYALAQYCATTALCYMMHNTSVAGLCATGSEALKQEFLPKVAKGEIAFALAFSESGSGTHFGEPDITEEVNGKDRILKGRKSFVTSAKHADYYLTYTNSCQNKGTKNIWLVHKDSKNLLHEENVWNGLGMRGNASVPVQYNGVSVSEALRIGDEGQGESAAGAVLMHFVTGLAAVYSGLAKAAYDCALNHTKTRQYTNKTSLSDVELVRIHLADMYAKTQSGIALALDAANSFDRGAEDAVPKIFASRINATHNVMEVCTLAMRLGGGKAYSKLLPLERYMRDALASQVMAPSLDVLKVWLGDAITK
ncbi:acyl-CoA dehydrogenase family protein [Helicobacter turcicus]|uniref:Acyl-CoA/acyl-ACP dehydrogenase n=1 Tax=Helicobacter turcicus TaxID=2867412 RepID=A0ABS7JMJ5_9HELI|nr:acyl-CoA dehydrogenase family protein [Helicobacter turcicus]MBX7490594.1 acyl-CoA/acyl-ACP dehydrogenase [Helicobacter turcicus]MBX7545496.1 acyl-CoA/acyl-ACP dehydrogenase [Helicobacter turcicus]